MDYLDAPCVLSYLGRDLKTALQMSVEVERKFSFNADTLKTLEETGVCIGQRQFCDRYFDTPQFDLTLRDVWLRKRQGCWELKCATRVKGTEETGGQPAALCTCYKEITNLHDVQLKVKEVIKVAREDTGGAQQEQEPSTRASCENQSESVTAHRGLDSTGQISSQEDESWLSEMNLVCFAEFTTVRRSFTLEEEGVHVDLDQADFGYSVGEIEVLIPEGGDVQSAQEKIGKTAQRLGLTGDQQVEGKMSSYLKRNHPEHYARLRSERIL